MPMIEPKDAIAAILNTTSVLGTETRAFEEAIGLVLAEDIISRHPMPPFDNSAMDGFAVRAADITDASKAAPVTLRLIEEQPAGSATDVAVAPGTAIKIMTGAPVPGGADTVVQVELTAERDGTVEIQAAKGVGKNIRCSGEEMAAGTAAVPAGTVIDHIIIGVLASLGYPEVTVYRRTRVAIIGTGSELIPVEAELSPGKIRDSNSYALTAQAKAVGAETIRMGVASDTREETTRMVREALEQADIVVTSGGVSVGEYDHVKDVIQELGGKLHFWGVRQKPGKPLAFWTIGNKLIFGLPGNPVASLLCFEEYVRPAVLKMMGREKLFRPVVAGALTHDFKKKAGRHHFVGAIAERTESGYKWSVNGRQGSGMLRSLTGANGIAVIPADVTEMKTGDRIAVQLVTLPEDH